MKIKIVHLPVHLTDAELRAKAKLQAQTMVEYGELEAERKAAAAALALQIRGKRAELDRLASEVRTGLETRPVECELVPRWDAHTVATVRRDTGEAVDVRAMTPAERQLQLRAVVEPDEDDPDPDEDEDTDAAH